MSRKELPHLGVVRAALEGRITVALPTRGASDAAEVILWVAVDSVGLDLP